MPMPTPNKEARAAIGRWLKDRRNAVGLTQRDLTESLGFNYISIVAQIEAGKVRVPPPHYRDYARLLKVPLKEFISRVDPEMYRLVEDAREEEWEA